MIGDAYDAVCIQISWDVSFRLSLKFHSFGATLSARERARDKRSLSIELKKKTEFGYLVLLKLKRDTRHSHNVNELCARMN